MSVSLPPFQIPTRESNPLWLAESLSQVMEFESSARVMDLGCGKAITSIFLAQEFQLQVWATDLWVSAGDNWQRIRAAKREQQVFPTPLSFPAWSEK